MFGLGVSEIMVVFIFFLIPLALVITLIVLGVLKFLKMSKDLEEIKMSLKNIESSVQKQNK